MKMISKIFLLAVIMIQGVSAQEKQKEGASLGFIRIVNTIAPGTGNVDVTINSKKIYPAGYRFGAISGGIDVIVGSNTVTIRRKGVEEGTTKITMDKDQTVTLIAFAEKVSATDQKPAHFAIRILRLQQKDVQDGRSASFISVSDQPEVIAELRDPTGKWEKIFVKRLTISETVIQYPRGYAPVRVNGTDMEPIPIGDLGNYVVILYDDADGKLQSANFRDFKFLSAN